MDQPSVLMKRMKRSHHLSHLEKVKLWRQRRNMTLEKALVKKLKEELAEVRAEVIDINKRTNKNKMLHYTTQPYPLLLTASLPS